MCIASYLLQYVALLQNPSAFYFSLKALCILSVIGLNKYPKNKRDPVRINTSAGMPGYSSTGFSILLIKLLSTSMRAVFQEHNMRMLLRMVKMPNYALPKLRG